MQVIKKGTKIIKESYFGPVLIIIAALLWAADGVIRRYLYSLPPITIIFFEHLFGLILLLPFIYKDVLKAKFTNKEWGLLVVVALLSGLLGTLWFTTALLKVNFISLSVVFLLQKLQPIFAVTSASIFLKEKLHKDYLVWAPLALVAAFFVTFKNGFVDFNTGSGTVQAALFALGAAFAWGTSTTFSKMILKKTKADVTTFYRFLFTILMSIPVLFFFNKVHTLADPTPAQFGFFFLIAVSTGMVAMLIYYRGLARTPVHISTMLELVFPFLAIVIDNIVFGVVLSWSQWIAAFILVFSIYKIVKLRNDISIDIESTPI